MNECENTPHACNPYPADTTFLDDGPYAVLSECDLVGTGPWAQCFATEAEAVACKGQLDRDGCTVPDGCRGRHRVVFIPQE